MTHSVFIDGAAGTTGLEIAERLAGRSEFELIALDETRRKDVGARREALHAADFAILCLHDDAAREAVALAEGSRVRIIDASSAHRVAPGWTYGFPEIVGRDAVAGARLVSNPGCYPTGFLALLAPLVRSRLLPADWPYTVNAVSGTSGGGKALIERFEGDADIAFRAYGLVLGHKHVPEMQQYAGLAHAPVFSPAVVPAYRGMVVDVPLPLAAMHRLGHLKPKNDHLAGLIIELGNCLVEFYKGSRVVEVASNREMELLLRKSATPRDGMTLHVCHGDDPGQARLIAVLDNLGKGASGAAVQNLNLMAGLPETEGLRI